VVLVPIALMALGLGWFLSSVGLFVRDVAQVVPVLLTLLMFLSPLFYPVEAVPEAMRSYLLANPVAFAIGQARGVLLWGESPDWAGLGAAAGAAWLVAWLGLLWFARTRKGFADVV
jgi:lipopolysaccharide transport system permease protein